MKLAFCTFCNSTQPHYKAVHHSGESMWQCEGCKLYRARLLPVKKVKKNPVPLSKNAQLKKASKLYSDFTGHDAGDKVYVDKPEIPDIVCVIGDIDEIFYTTVRDGNIEKYRHAFKRKCRPLFCVTPDGKQIIMIGGSYDFTERGIVDRE